jgi:protein-disulfide isomerase-like protein with CxxC motif
MRVTICVRTIDSCGWSWGFGPFIEDPPVVPGAVTLSPP